MHATAPRWWRAAGALQRLLALAVAVGLVWLLALGVLGYLLVDDLVPVPEVRDVPIPTWLVVGGAVAGIVLALLARLVNGAAAERRSRAAARSLHARVADVGQELVIAPVEVELDAHARFCAAIAVAAVRGVEDGAT
jgi:RsiW-degrading membrane proteinase PrsW (M82 family)